MIALLLTTLLLMAVSFGWYAHRAYLRISEWGERMNEQDAIFRVASEEEFDGTLRRVRVLRFDERGGEAVQPISLLPNR
jgi:hypothetical protein